MMMLLNSSAAKALAIIVLTNIEGPDAPRRQLPLQIEDRGELWLVKGTPHTDVGHGLNFAQFHVFFRKADAEILGFGEDGRQIADAEEARYLRQVLGDDVLARLATPIEKFEPWTDHNPVRDIYLASLGGFINKPASAVDYAHILMEASGPRLGNIPKTSLKAEEREGVWHVSITSGFPPNGEVLSFSRKTGKLLSGNL